MTYIDESGKPERSDPEDEFVLAALIVNESVWKEIDTRVLGLKRKYFPSRDPISVELHATDIINHKGPFKTLPLEVRLSIYSDIIKIISEVDCAITAVVIRKDRLYSETLDVHSFAMELLFERLCFFSILLMEKMSGKVKMKNVA